MMSLAQLLSRADCDLTLTGQGSGEVMIRDLALDSRKVSDGSLFAALPGSQVDGMAFADQAIKAGAVAILAPKDADDLAVPMILSDHPRADLAEIAGVFFADRPDHLAAVTGTNGKSSVVHFTRQIWASQGLQAVSMGTLGIDRGDGAPQSLGHTSPDVVTYHRTLKALADEGVTHCALEASSHGLDQYRHDGAPVQVAAFTNLSRDHLDYHQTEDAYLQAKMGLFDRLLAKDGIAIAMDGPWLAAIQNKLADQTLWVIGNADRADLVIRDHATTASGQSATVSWQGQDYHITLPLIGGFQMENALVAALMAMATGVAAADAFAALSNLSAVAGRMEVMPPASGKPTVLVDYAHTPDALEAALSACRGHLTGKGQLAVVFGCGGDRDKGKRPQMGAIADRLADRVYVTDDNPRSEDAAMIRAEIMAASPRAIEVGDRADAIRQAIEGLTEGDMLLIAGKGHETGQTIGDQTMPFDDRAIALELLS